MHFIAQLKQNKVLHTCLRIFKKCRYLVCFRVTFCLIYLIVGLRHTQEYLMHFMFALWRDETGHYQGEIKDHVQIAAVQ